MRVNFRSCHRGGLGHIDDFENRWTHDQPREFVCFNSVMTEPVEITTTPPTIGDTLQVRRLEGGTATGTVVEDFADYLLTVPAAGRYWAMPHRWAIASEDGTLIFADDADIIEHHKSEPSTTAPTTPNDISDKT